MVFRMAEYGVRFALQHADSDTADDILIELPHAVVFYLRDNNSTPRELNVTIRVPDNQELHYTIPTELMSDYTPEKFEREWQAGCTKLADFVKHGYMEKADAEKLVEGSRIVIEKTGFSDEKKEVLKKMTMFDKVGVGTDWIELKRREDERIAKVRDEGRKATAKKAIEMGLSPEQAAKLANLPLDEIMALV